MSDVVAVTDETFETEVLSSDKPVVIEFWAPWCGPCKMVSPLIAELAREFTDTVNFRKLNVDDNPITTRKFDIRSLPTIIVLRDGEVLDFRMGYRPKKDLRSFIRAAINKPSSKAPK